jgi:two-component system chemotaxis response regulator CheB
MIRVLVVEDSPVACALLVHLLNSDAAIQVMGTAASGREALGFMAHNKPDLITMDIHMLEMDGFEATRIIMETNPVPIVIVTGSADMQDLETSFRAIEAGALTILPKPQGIGHPDHEKDTRHLLTTVKLMSEIKVVRRWARKAERGLPPRGKSVIFPAARVKVVAIGASTGGPPVIENILKKLPVDFPAPVLIVQHMAKGFVHGFAEWLGQTSSLPVHVPVHGSMTRSGHVYIAPDDVHMGMDAAGRIFCTNDAPENGLRPSVSHLFRSAAKVFSHHAVGVLLTGMGKDGSAELKLMKDAGAITIAQNEQSSVVYGMPGEAVRLDAAHYVVFGDRIAQVLTSIAMGKREERNRVSG